VLVDTIAPVVTSIDTNGASQTDASTVTFTVAFSKDVTGVAANDFTVTGTGGTTGTISSITAVTGSTYTVTVSNVSGAGALRLDVNSSGTGIVDRADNPLAGGFTGGEAYTVGVVAAPPPVGRGLLPGTEAVVPIPSMNPFIWLQPLGEASYQPAHAAEALPTTSQTVWSPVPLLSAGEEGFGHIDDGINRGDATEIGRSALDAGDRSLIDRLVNPLPVELVALKGAHLDRSDNLTSRQPHVDLESSDVRSAESMTSASGSTEGSPGHPVTRHVAAVGGKESLNEQFTRYGRSAWQREQSQLVGSAQRIVRQPAG
jgi:hypothetical protein